MERKEAVEKLTALEGVNLHDLARQLSIKVVAESGKTNKGWAGHTCERYLGLPINSSQSPNFGSWELKVIPLSILKNGRIAPKETMKITMIDAYNVSRTPFESSHLLSKLQKAVIVARTVGENVFEPSFVRDVQEFDLSGEDYDQVREDYELVRDCINDPKRGFSSLSGSMGTLVQPRTNGAGHGSTSRAFYARTSFLKKIFQL